MTQSRTKVCGMSWCGNPVALLTIGVSRRINGIEVCRRCYQYIWEQAKARGRTMQEVFTFPLEPPKRALPRVQAVCARKNCGTVFPEGEGSHTRRHIGLLHVCRRCYQKTWEVAKEKGITLEEAWKVVPPKGWKPPKPEPVVCCLPWCNTEMFSKKKHRQLGENAYPCGNCVMWLKLIARMRFKNTRTWYELGLDAIKGNLQGPNIPETCSMPWCSRQEIARGRGPNGEPVCNTDRTYLYLYAKRHNVSKEEAFRTAPKPLLRGVRR